MPLYGAYRPFLWVPSGLETGGIPSWKVAKGIPPCHLGHSVTKKSTRDTLYDHPQPLWQHFREWRTDALFQNLQLITRLLSSTVDLVQTYQKAVGY